MYCFFNNSGETITIEWNTVFYTVYPQKKFYIDSIESDNSLTIGFVKKSRKKFLNQLFLSIESEFDIFEKNECFFEIFKEERRIRTNVILERVVLIKDNAEYKCKSFSVSKESEIKKQIKKMHLWDVFFWNIVIEGWEFLRIFWILGVILCQYFGAVFALVYFPATYLLTGLFDWIMNRIFNGTLGLNDSKTELMKFFEKDFLSSFFT